MTSISLTVDQGDIDGLIDDILDQSEEQLKGTAVSLQETLSEETPVDTELSESNWIATNSSPSSEVRPIGSKSSNKIEAMSLKYKLNEVHYITNNVDYLSFVNDGTARIRPRKFVEKSITSVLARENSN